VSPHCLVIAPNWVGDVVMALPTLEALAASGRELTVLARPHLRPLLALVPAVTATVPHAAETGETVARLRALGIDEAVVLPNSFRSAWLARRAGIDERWGYRGQLRSALLSRAVPAPRGKHHQVEDYRELLAAMGVAPPDPPLPSLAVPEALRAATERRLAAVEAGREGPRIGIFPGAEFGPSKRWPEERFAALAGDLRTEMPGARLLVLAGPSEGDLGSRVAATQAPLLGPDLDLAELAAVLAQLDLLVTNDSGPMHLAAAVGVRCVALFGPTDPVRTRPLGERHAVLYTDRWCSPCFRRRCPLRHQRCLREIGVERVLAEIEGALGRAG